MSAVEVDRRGASPAFPNQPHIFPVRSELPLAPQPIRSLRELAVRRRSHVIDTTLKMGAYQDGLTHLKTALQLAGLAGSQGIQMSMIPGYEVNGTVDPTYLFRMTWDRPGAGDEAYPRFDRLTVVSNELEWDEDGAIRWPPDEQFVRSANLFDSVTKFPNATEDDVSAAIRGARGEAENRFRAVARLFGPEASPESQVGLLIDLIFLAHPKNKRLAA
ncbi:hypothetical protein A3G67_00850 [Candidatus Roizmanbacteria bacterium RIFCSPLOWO2_12_FULL_40_12]|uniref:Uncharacterized protein n=1 Tax=Candidatus Roizmanbacteria bacterium RIFCSPLOWO2_01_FULL_40_42 TaxID=1802066 RepID=A0A1F7J6U8_9BACT|nr:MAG: hypothetical protein A2779_02375 [Candidatus Roizmanbacteria bacterium RIFCSPHIGHO2_01_FULL_40_98]OGK27197.1 MAG: hypothetical protein A3C31_03010 [Candidatus Roizmanbacteria bacterium RIFCSPHIGHO2_02_FULL_40_53]OGK30070.1 MAG: hypothetical protein A2W49_04045 [Candidatus Roizmanbacteria bacterium RIFCSPHIGHO2_12_41_18]OGK36070.1 MAG: hypothetical protein A3E69_02955 [Candidatus Roizmanbacteria bacterium RIFCSPHIGHO2_12_FULL_40_130]OGK51309.1 MAG: hypothetical protein A3B50_02590 [Candi